MIDLLTLDCLYEGPGFQDLMAHISRRHPQATPDDFVPGLIHFRPPLPHHHDLPSLPGEILIVKPSQRDLRPLVQQSEEEEEGGSYPVGEDLVVLRGCPSMKVSALVSKGCMSTRRRAKRDGWAEKKGDLAATGAVIDNCRLQSARTAHLQPQGEISTSLVATGENSRNTLPNPTDGLQGKRLDSTPTSAVLLDPEQVRKEVIRLAYQQKHVDIVIR
jgi:hypothetical protein